MAEVTVLVSPTSMRPRSPALGFNLAFGRQSQNDLTACKPVMVTLERPPPDLPAPKPTLSVAVPAPGESEPDGTSTSFPSSAPSSPVARSRAPKYDHNLLSPPRNTWKRPASPPKRPLSAPPTRTTFDAIEQSVIEVPKVAAPRPIFNRRAFTTSWTASTKGQVSRPPLRPTTFWRNTKRSGVTSASYSPSSYIIRRSTFIAAGLDLDKPTADLSALCVESRVGLIVLGPQHSGFQ
ncbi:hypothetical protein CONPUDRAFT_140691 [Coniophora puteana RWD-64-598 SS2]|uniref:Uncharacterized protein n=1 Tax=Coniophora puteana (strain RWD-64-598) TaxID=741705 RepID=R7SCT2_CONPW|nr:uncharacterized protein CONPUDRAFT_140691 [Coniophora puteana RWD-64-598 SS2]EIW73968.1 hypothetical protein CONPUDRAFT_140691 [Coniophora puteana RWD-64-598 SS2]